MARGGRRTATPGSLQPQRTDMRTTQAVQAPSGGNYGDRKATEEALAAMPLENTAGVQNQAIASAPPPQGVFPGELGALDRPTERPDEPLTAGAPVGPGPGPEALSMLGAGNELDQANGQDIQEMGKHLPALELLSTMPGSSAALRNFVRRLRASVPRT